MLYTVQYTNAVHSTIHDTVQYIVQYTIRVGTSNITWTNCRGIHNYTWWSHRMGCVRRVDGALGDRDTLYTQDTVLGGTDCTGQAETRSWIVMESPGESWNDLMLYTVKYTI